MSHITKAKHGMPTLRAVLPRYVWCNCYGSTMMRGRYRYRVAGLLFPTH